MMTVPCYYKLLVLMLAAILLLIDFPNFAKADDYADKDYIYDRYQYPDYQSSTYNFFKTLVQIILLTFLRSWLVDLKEVPSLKFVFSHHVSAKK